MLAPILMAFMLQAQTPDPCNAVGAAAAGARGCPAWRPVVIGRGDAFVDPASVTRTGDTLEIRYRSVPNPPFGREHSSIFTYRFECRPRLIVPLHAAMYDEDGTLFRRVTLAGEQGPRPRPATHWEAAMNEFCPRTPAARTSRQTAELCNAVDDDAATIRPPSCPIWRFLGTSVDADTFADPTTLRRTATGFEIRQRVIYHRASHGIRTAIVRSLYDCQSRMFSALGIIHYTARGSFRRAEQPTDDRAQPRPVVADTTDTILLDEYCPR